MPKKGGQSTKSHSSSPSSSSRPTTSQRFSRTKTGCFTCRARRKKCDEARDPQSGACARCRNSGIECLGFPPLKSAPVSAHWKQSIAHAKEAGNSLFPELDHTVPPAPPPSITTAFNLGDVSTSQARNEWQEDGGVVRWADLMALDGGEQLFYEGMFYDSNFKEPELESATTTALPCASLEHNPPNSSSATTNTRTNSIITPRQEEEEEPDSQQEDRALTVLSNFYAMFSWYRWQPTRRGYTKDQLVLALKSRLQRSEVLCISVASLAACYEFSDSITLPENSIRRSFSKHWTMIYNVVTSTKTRKLCSFLEWLGETSNNGSAGQHHMTAAETIRVGAAASSSSSSSTVGGGGGGNPNKSRGETLFSLASRVLYQIAFAANQDQELPTDRSSPLDTAALVHVDKYLHAAMDLAIFAYASRSSQAFLLQLDSAHTLLNSLLGQSQCVKLSDLQGIETTGLRTFVWADVINAVLSGRSTFLHYLFDDEAIQRRNSMQERGEVDAEVIEADEENTSGGIPSRDDGLEICFGCPDDVLVIMASIANLHFQLRHARNAGAIGNGGGGRQGPEFLPAWALYAALDLSNRLEASREEAAEERQLRSSSSPTPLNQTKKQQQQQRQTTKKTTVKTEIHSLGVMWRHAASIFLHTTIYRQGPLSAINQKSLCGIMNVYSGGTLRPMTIAMGDAAMPLLFAAFVAVSVEDRKQCHAALYQAGQEEVGRKGYRKFVERLWKRSDETGFGILWQDLAMASGAAGGESGVGGESEVMAVM